MESVFQLFASTFEICSLIGKELVGFPSPSDEPSKRQQEGISIHVIQQVKMYFVRHLYTIPHLFSVRRPTFTTSGPKQSTPVE